MSEREMTLKEWVERLHPEHKAREEYEALINPAPLATPGDVEKMRDVLFHQDWHEDKVSSPDKLHWDKGFNAAIEKLYKPALACMQNEIDRRESQHSDWCKLVDKKNDRIAALEAELEKFRKE